MTEVIWMVLIATISYVFFAGYSFWFYSFRKISRAVITALHSSTCVLMLIVVYNQHIVQGKPFSYYPLLSTLFACLIGSLVLGFVLTITANKDFLFQTEVGKCEKWGEALGGSVLSSNILGNKITITWDYDNSQYRIVCLDASMRSDDRWVYVLQLWKPNKHGRKTIRERSETIYSQMLPSKAMGNLGQLFESPEKWFVPVFDHETDFLKAKGGF